MADVEIDVLGALRLRVDGVPVEVPGGRRRALLALLGLEVGRIVSIGGIIDALWGDDPPVSGRGTVQTQISRLRLHLGPHAGLLRREGAGYLLALPGDAIDANRAAALASRGRALAPDDPGTVLALLTGALELWRGVALAEFADVPPLAAEARRLAELRAALVDESLEARLAVDPPGEVVEKAGRAAAADPWRESTHRVLMKALALAGRAPEAMSVAREFRRRLADETGLEPSAALMMVERAVARGELVAALPARPPRRVGVPHAPTPLLGRDAELSGLAAVLRVERCVSIVGPGGVGKTRLAVEFAHRVAADGGVTMVELAAVREPGTIPYVVAQALGVRGSGDLLKSVIEQLCTRETVLVLDNCEHLLDAVRRLCNELLRWCPQLRVLATSRQPFGAVGESVFRLHPLALPGDPRTALDAAVVRLFADRARRARPDFRVDAAVIDDVLAICRQVDGLPLAIELTAGRVAGLTLAELRRRVPAVLDITGPGRRNDDDRHRTLRSTVSWSYELLGAAARRLFRYLSVFPDRFELEAAEHLGRGGDTRGDPLHTIVELVDASMIVADLGGDIPSYRMLDTIRAFGAEQLAAHGEQPAVHRLLADWAVSFSERAAAGVQSPDEPAWAARIVTALPTLRAARRYLIDHGDVAGVARISVALEDFSLWRQYAEPWAWSLEAVELPPLRGMLIEAPAVATACRAAIRLGRLTLAAELADRADRCARDDEGRGEALGVRGLLDAMRGDNRGAVRHFVAAAGLLPSLTRNYLANAALSAGYSGSIDEASTLLDEAERITGPSNGLTVRAWVAYAWGEVLSRAGDPRAQDYLERAQSLARTSQATLVEGMAGLSMAVFAARSGDVATALVRFPEVVQGWQRTGSWALQWITLRAAAVLLAGLGADEEALVVLTAADADADAPAVREDDAARLDHLRTELERRVGPVRAEQLRGEARRMPRTDIVDRALAGLAAAGNVFATGHGAPAGAVAAGDALQSHD